MVATENVRQRLDSKRPVLHRHLALHLGQVLAQTRFRVELGPRGNPYVSGIDVLPGMLLYDFLDPFDLDRLDIDVRIGRPCEGHQEYFLEQLVLLVFVDVRAAEDIQYVLEICECHYVLSPGFLIVRIRLPHGRQEPEYTRLMSHRLPLTVGQRAPQPLRGTKPKML